VHAGVSYEYEIRGTKAPQYIHLTRRTGRRSYCIFRWLAGWQGSEIAWGECICLLLHREGFMIRAWMSLLRIWISEEEDGE
jgi:hypothetical protein